MSILPTVTHDNNSFSVPPVPRPAMPLIFKRLLKPRQMDFELAAWQLTYMCLAPKRVYRNVYFHKQTKNTWARDDPAVLILLSICLAVAGLAWSIVYSYSPVEALWVAFLMVFRDFLFVGVLVASLIWVIANRFLLSPPTHTTPENQRVEWAYAFDIHINSFFPFFLTVYVAQLFLVAVITRDNWLCLFVGNTLYLAAFSQYVYGLYLGLNALPFLIRTQLFLAPLLPLSIGYVVSLLGFNIGRTVLSLYFR